MDSIGLKQRFYPEATMGGFSHADTVVEFFTRIAALLKPEDRVLDYGAGRGGHIANDLIPYRRKLRTLRGRVARLDGCDIDAAVLENPYIDEARLIETPSAPLPYDDETFDLIFCSWVFEHVDDPQATADELLRILKPGGYICAITPNKLGYLAAAASLAGNKRHARLLTKIQPEREEFDEFPTRYRLNTPGAVRRYFGRGAETVAYRMAGEPAYHFNRAPVFALLKLAHRLMPSVFYPTLLIFVRKFPR